MHGHFDPNPAGAAPELTFGERLVIARGRAGLSQGDVARRIGVSRNSISAWERGEFVPEQSKLVDVAEGYALGSGIPPWWILGLDSADEFQQFKLLRRTLRVVQGGGRQPRLPLPGLGPDLTALGPGD